MSRRSALREHLRIVIVAPSRRSLCPRSPARTLERGRQADARKVVQGFLGEVYCTLLLVQAALRISFHSFSVQEHWAHVTASLVLCVGTWRA